MATEKYNLMTGGATDNFKSVSVALTNAATTTAEVAMGPYVIGGIANTGAGDRTITLTAAPTNGGTSLALYDSDGVAVPTISLVNNSYHAIDIAAYVPYLIVTANAAAATGITMHFKKQG
jgi:hypothetical protein